MQMQIITQIEFALKYHLPCIATPVERGAIPAYGTPSAYTKISESTTHTLISLQRHVAFARIPHMQRPSWPLLAPNLRNARERAGLTLPEVATRTGLGLTSLYSWERGTVEPQATSLVMLCALYGLEIRTLVAA